MKISIVGASNSGKSTLARKISDTFDIPYLQIDRLWFDCGGNDLFQNKSTDKVAREKVSTEINSKIKIFLANNEHWVCDGTYGKSQSMIAEQADVIISLQRPLAFRMWSNVIRVFTDTHRHPEVTKWQDFKFTQHLAKRHKNNEQQKIDDLIAPFHKKVTVLRSFREIDTYFKNL